MRAQTKKPTPQMIDQITRHHIVPVAVIHDAADAVPLAEALCAGGLPIIEVPLRTPVALEAVRLIRRHLPQMLVGVGTLMSADQVSAAMAVGAQFGLSAGLNPDVVRAAQKAGLFFMPGVLTPTEIEVALGLGVRLLKFFPAGPVGGVPMLNAIAAPYAHTGVQFVPLGGVNLDNMVDYLKLSSVPAIGGSWICDQALVRGKRWNEITQLTRAAVERAAGAKRAAGGAK